MIFEYLETTLQMVEVKLPAYYSSQDETEYAYINTEENIVALYLSDSGKVVITNYRKDTNPESWKSQVLTYIKKFRTITEAKFHAAMFQALSRIQEDAYLDNPFPA